MAKRRFGRSDIPYKDRLLMDKYNSTAKHRDEAARVALCLACVALNNTEGLGLVRLTRFAQELQGLIKEYYDDTEVGEVHLAERLRQIGFVVKDGRIFAMQAEGGELLPTKKISEVSGHGS